MQNQQPPIIFGYLRIWQIVGDRKRSIEPLLPVGRSTFLAGVKSGKYQRMGHYCLSQFAW
jgi:prophage regulatory protein